MKNKTQIFILLLIMVTLASCRYDEGPMLSFRTVEKRVAKEHSVVEFTKDNDDMTQELIDSCGKDWKFVNTISDINLRIYPQGIDIPFFGCYNISSNKKNIDIYIDGYNPGYIGITPFKKSNFTVWAIERLTKNEMWLSCTYDNSDYYLKLEEYED